MVISAPPATVPSAALLPAAQVAAANPAPHGWTTYRVRPGDTLVGIAARFRTTVGAIAARNSVRNPRALMVGTVLRVPRTSAAPRAADRRRATSRVHVVRSGDTLFDIAVRYRVPLASLLKANHLSARSFIQPGQRIVVRATAGKAAAPSSRASSTRYRVRAGDTLSSIAARHHTTVAAIARASSISSRALIHPGQVLRVPGKARSGSGTAVPDTFNGVKYPRAIAEAAARNRAILAHRSVPSRSETKARIVRIARQQGVDPRLALAIAYQESGWNQRAVSPANAVGVMQVIPQAGQWASGLVGRRLDLLKTRDNITAGVVMLRSLGRSTDSMEKAVAAYYQGLGALQKHGMYADTKLYVRNVMALRRTM
ncbi:MAG: LysM peptidoglycan-binding domain-containing protein [Ornithinibacter sp.]